MPKTLVYDLVTRFFHWIFVVLFILAFSIAKIVDDDSPTYAIHMMAGLTLGFAILLRIVWGFVGTTYARFSSFLFQPTSLVNYFKGLLSGKSEEVAGHNPASSWSAIVMIALGLGMFLTGYQMINGQKEALEDVHEVFANALVIAVLAHIAGVAFHSISKKDRLWSSMLTGKKSLSSPSLGITSPRLFSGLAFIILVGIFGFQIFSNFDQGTRQTKVFGKILQLGEVEDGESKTTGSQGLESEHDDGDDD